MHKLEVLSLFVVALFYLVANFADFLAYADPEASDSRRGYIPPQSITWLDGDGALRPYVHGLKGVRDPEAHGEQSAAARARQGLRGRRKRLPLTTISGRA